jgi:nitroreductase
MEMVRAAILAANPHNTQPWLFRIENARIDLYADTRRQIANIDPYRREMYVGLGCALENLLLAAKAQGYSYEVSLAPNPADPNLAARIDLSPGQSVESLLYRAIPHRHTNRGPYDTLRVLPKDTLLALTALGRDLSAVTLHWFATEEERGSLGRLIVQATQAITADKDQSRETATWFRTHWKQVQEHRDGITVDASGASELTRALVKMLPRFSENQSDNFWLIATQDVQVATASAFGVLTVGNPDDIASRLECGQLWQRMHLWAVTHGLAMQPMNQVPERAAREQLVGLRPQFGNAMQELMAEQDGHILMMFRIGYPKTDALASPRRPLEDVLISPAQAPQAQLNTGISLHNRPPQD